MGNNKSKGGVWVWGSKAMQLKLGIGYWVLGIGEKERKRLPSG